MCHIYLSSDPIQYEARSRALRIHGVATTIRLENEFWGVLQRIAESEGKTTNQIITELYDEAMTREAEETPRNFASVLRVSCCRYLALHGDSGVVRRAAAPLARVAASAPPPTSLELVRTK